MTFIRHLKDVMRFMQLPEWQRRLVFYSEGKNYWPHLEGLVREMLSSTDIPLCYISSAADDPGLGIRHPNYRTFEIDEGFVRNWLFENMRTDVVVMTMPDLHCYQVKRSKHTVHYIYVQHSLVSLHMAYRCGAFDHYDTIFCAGPHHLREIRATEEKYDLPAKNLVEHGYGRLDAILEEAERRTREANPKHMQKHILVAPSWGPNGTIESGIGAKIVDQLMDMGCKVTLRPHPQTTKFANRQVRAICDRHCSNPDFSFESDVVGQTSLHDSDVMVSDWSGAALDYAFGLGKPVLFVDVPRKVNNPRYEELGIEPFEVSIRDKVGKVLVDGVITPEVLNELETHQHVAEDYFFPGANQRGTDALIAILRSLS